MTAATTPSVCPNCGETVPLDATACPGCGSDEFTGWSPAARYAHVMPEEGAAAPRSRTLRHATAVIAVVVVVALLAGVGGVREPYWLGAVALLLVGLLLVGRRLSARTGYAASKGQEGLQRLIALCHGDRAMAERLVAGEERRSPGLSRSALVLRAIERLRDDRRR